VTPTVGVLPTVGVAVGVVPRVGVAVGVVPWVGVAVGVEPVVGVGVGFDVPLQALPFTLKLVGTGLLLVHEPLKPGPGLTEAFAGTLPL
jgi:hypothetical protein